MLLASIFAATTPISFSDATQYKTNHDLLASVRNGDVSKPHVYVIYAGGTIGMVPSPDGYRPEPGFLTHMMSEELGYYFRAAEAPLYTVHEYQPLIDSSNAKPADWKAIADDIYANYDAYDGFVVVHGTDTMAYTASALSFLLGPELSKTVVVTGSQIPLSQVFTDGVFNLVGSLMSAAYSGVPEVGIFFDGKLMRGNRAQKMSAFDLGAFQTLSWPPLVIMGTSMSVQRREIRTAGSGRIPAPITPADDVVQVTIYPGVSAAAIEGHIRDARGVVLSCYGAGNAPDSDEALIAVLDRAIQRGVTIVDVSQTPKGLVQLGEYAVSGPLARIGVVSGADLTAEAAQTKLAWLLGRGLPVGEIRTLMTRNIVGELTPEETSGVDVVLEPPVRCED